MKIYQVDSFTTKPFKGNPAGVCILDKQISDSLMCNIAKEMNISETVFVLKQKDKFSIRWFTPTDEVNLCGHGTMAASFVLWDIGVVPKYQLIIYNSKSGELEARYNDGLIVLDFPTLDTMECERIPLIEKALGAKPVYIGISDYEYMVEVENAGIVRNMTPDFTLLKKLEDRGIIVTAVSDDSRYDFVSRNFSVNVGIDEDPVTGSTHCALGKYWMDKLGKNKFMAYQASERGGDVYVEVRGDRTIIGGKCVKVFEIEVVKGH